MKKGFVFDLDGVITDTAKFHYISDTKTHLELYKAFPTLGGMLNTCKSSEAPFWNLRRKRR